MVTKENWLGRCESDTTSNIITDIVFFSWKTTFLIELKPFRKSFSRNGLSESQSHFPALKCQSPSESWWSYYLCFIFHGTKMALAFTCFPQQAVFKKVFGRAPAFFQRKARAENLPNGLFVWNIVFIWMKKGLHTCFPRWPIKFTCLAKTIFCFHRNKRSPSRWCFY